MQPAMQEERSSWTPLLKRRSAEEEEARRKESLVCLFPERCRNCYMRNYLTSLTSPDALQQLHPPSFFEPSPSSCDLALCRAAAAASPLSYPGTGSWFPPGRESSSTSLCSKFICTCSSSWMDHVHSPYVDPGARLCLAEPGMWAWPQGSANLGRQ